MRNVYDLIQEQEEYLAEVKEAVAHWSRWCDTFEEAFYKAGTYDIDTGNVSDNEKWTMKRELGYGE